MENNNVMESQLIKIIDGVIANLSDEQVKERLIQLSKEMPVKSTSVLLNLQDNSSISNINRNYLKLIESLKVWIESGHDESIANEFGFIIKKY